MTRLKIYNNQLNRLKRLEGRVSNERYWELRGKLEEEKRLFENYFLIHELRKDRRKELN